MPAAAVMIRSARGALQDAAHPSHLDSWADEVGLAIFDPGSRLILFRPNQMVDSFKQRKMLLINSDEGKLGDSLRPRNDSF